MRKILIVKTGSTLPSLIERRGDFEDWFIDGMGVGPDDLLVIDVRKGQSFPELEQIGGVVITGSHEMVTDHWGWSERTAQWLRIVVAASVPVLAVCYGHQLLAQALGGKVDYNPHGREMGTVDVFLTEEAKADELLGIYRSPIRVQVSHAQSVLRLPKSAIRLGWSRDDPNQAFRIGEKVWGLQFHPEFDKEVVQAYIEYHREMLIKEGKNPEQLIRNNEETEFGRKILRRFSIIAKSAI
jgi:GMP synthase (glutamine-hydrolysing)